MSKLIKNFKKVLNAENTKESDVQTFLEKNSKLIPLPFKLNHQLHFNAIISKFKISDAYITDFAYLTKSTDFWEFVLIELEDPNKRIFAKKGDNYVFHYNFNNAYDQITSWKAYIENNFESVTKKVNSLRKPLSRNSIRYKYVLVIGRNDEKNSEIKKRLIAQKSNDNIRVMTYDSLISTYQYGIPKPKIILSHWKEGYKIKYLNTYDTSLFAYVSPDFLKVSKKHKKILIEEGFDIEAWEEGQFLAYNNKYPLSGVKNSINNKFNK